MATHKISLNDLNRRIIVLEHAWDNSTEKVYHVEYDGSILTGASLLGTSSTEYDAINDFNCFNWISSDLTLQDCTVSLQFTLPSTFKSWTSNALTLYLQTNSSLSADNKIKLVIKKDNAIIITLDDNVSPSSSNWATTLLTSSNLGSWNPYNKMTILITLSSKSSNFARIADLKLDWN